jgi:hypothetical protein
MATVPDMIPASIFAAFRTGSLITANNGYAVVAIELLNSDGKV